MLNKLKKNQYSIIQGFLDKVLSIPSNIALVSNNIKYSYRDLFLMAFFLKRKILLKKKTNKKIGILCERTAFDIVAIIAILLSGNTYIPFNAKHPRKKILEIAEKNQIKQIFSKKIMDNSEKNFNKTTSHKDCNIYLSKINFTKQIFNQDAYVIFTSGSTGMPKGVKITHKNVLSFIRECGKIFKINERKKNFILIPDLSFDLSIFPMWYCFKVGGTLFYPTTKEKLNLIHYIKKKKINIFCSTPSLIDYFQNLNLLKKQIFHNIKLSVFCGEPFFVKQFKLWSQVCKNSKIFNTYGPTEATCFCSYYQCNKKYLKGISENVYISIGKFFKNIRCYLINNKKSSNEEGHLLLSGDQVFSGYLNKKKFSSTSFKKIKSRFYYKTGDHIIKKKNNYFFSKRIDRQIKVSGFRVELKEIENLLNKYTKKYNFVFYSDKSKEIIAVLRKSNKTLNNIKKYLGQNLPEYMIPKKLVLMKNFPLTLNQKIDFKKITSKYE